MDVKICDICGKPLNLGKYGHLHLRFQQKGIINYVTAEHGWKNLDICCYCAEVLQSGKATLVIREGE